MWFRLAQLPVVRLDNSHKSHGRTFDGNTIKTVLTLESIYLVVATYSNFQVSSNHHQGHSKVQISFNFSFSQNNAKIYNSFKRIIRRKVIIIETSGWRHLKEKISSFLAVNIKNYILPAQKWLNFLEMSQVKNGNLYQTGP